MPTSTRFAVATHLLISLAVHRDEPLRSEVMAVSVNTNPAVVRSLLSRLNQAGLTCARLGPGGGALLAKEPEAICLLEVFRAVEGPELFALHRTPPDPSCSVGRYVQSALRPVMARAQGALEASLAGVTLADMVADIRRRETAGEVPA